MGESLWEHMFRWRQREEKRQNKASYIDLIVEGGFSAAVTETLFLPLLYKSTSRLKDLHSCKGKSFWLSHKATHIQGYNQKCTYVNTHAHSNTQTPPQTSCRLNQLHKKIKKSVYLMKPKSFHAMEFCSHCRRTLPAMPLSVIVKKHCC